MGGLSNQGTALWNTYGTCRWMNRNLEPIMATTITMKQMTSLLVLPSVYEITEMMMMIILIMFPCVSGKINSNLTAQIISLISAPAIIFHQRC